MELTAFFSTHRERAYFLFRYGVSGAAAGIIQIAGLYIWVSLLGLQTNYLLGVIISYCIALIVTFAIQKYWTFRDHAQGVMSRQIAWYTLISLGNLGLNALILHIGKLEVESMGIEFFQGWYLAIQAIAVVFCSGVSFLCNRYITFRTIDPGEARPV